MGLEENPGPLTQMDGAADLVGCEGGSKVITGAEPREIRTGGLVGDGPLAPTDCLLTGTGGSMLIVGVAGNTGIVDAISGSSGSTMLGMLGSSGTTIVGIGGIGEADLPGALMVGTGTSDVRYALSRGGSIFGMACLLNGEDLGESDPLEVRGGVEETAGGGATAGTLVSSRTISFCCFQLWSKLTMGRPSLSLTAVG